MNTQTEFDLELTVIPFGYHYWQKWHLYAALAFTWAGFWVATYQAWIEEDVAQCGYCQAGQIMAAADLLVRIPKPSDEQIEAQQTNLSRCGTYARIRKAIHRAAGEMS